MNIFLFQDQGVAKRLVSISSAFGDYAVTAIPQLWLKWGQLQLQSAAERSKTLAAQAASAAGEGGDDVPLNLSDDDGDDVDHYEKPMRRVPPVVAAGNKSAISSEKEAPLATTSATVQQKMTGEGVFNE